MAARPTTPASPKNVKIKPPVPGNPMFGCGTKPISPCPVLLCIFLEKKKLCGEREPPSSFLGFFWGGLTLALDVDSRSGILYCQMCDDFVWDPTFEDLRIKKLGTSSFHSKHHQFSRGMHQVW